VHNGAAKCWGADTNGQLGNGATTGNQVSPVQVDGLTSGVTDIAVYGESACAIHNGAAKCWGLATDGRLGNGQTSGTYPSPVQVDGLTSGVTAISTGSTHACAIQSGSAKCWGAGGVGRLGNGGTASSATPVQVDGLTSGVTSISAGNSLTCAVHNGAAKCWGSDTAGRLGNGPVITASQLTPSQVDGLTSGVTTISVYAGHVCAIQSGSPKCSGSDTNGQLGNDPALTNQPSPVQVAGFAGLAGFPAALVVEVSDGVSTVTASVTLTHP
jgi:alpha-tubulin suppressor-like RCC1 family protein